MALTNSEKVHIRRLLGYETYSGNPTVTLQSDYSKLEYKIARLDADEENFVKERLSLLLEMEAEVYEARQNFQVKAAGSFIQNPDEVKERKKLYSSARRELAKFLGVKLRGLGRGSVIV